MVIAAQAVQNPAYRPSDIFFLPPSVASLAGEESLSQGALPFAPLLVDFAKDGEGAVIAFAVEVFVQSSGEDVVWRNDIEQSHRRTEFHIVGIAEDAVRGAAFDVQHQ